MHTDWKDLIPAVAKRAGVTEEEAKAEIERYANDWMESYRAYKHFRYDVFGIGILTMKISYIRGMLKKNPLLPVAHLLDLYSKPKRKKK